MEQPDTPRSAYRVLERRATVTTVGILLILAAAAWWSTLGTARDMGDMVSGLGAIGTKMMPSDVNAGVFLAMWVTMMVAMMFPTIGPIVLLHRMVMRRRGEGALPTVAFVGGYLVVWTAAGLVPLAALVGFRGVTAGTYWVAPLGGAILIGAGAYQFTRWKQTCLRACRSPMTFLMTHDFGAGPVGAFRVGVSHGAFCLGCCWALMSVLVVVGLMNIAWMAVLAVLFLAEKTWQHGAVLTKVAGTAVIALGVAIVLRPDVLTLVSM
jgi:predicted metal-binding membrane protein